MKLKFAEIQTFVSSKETARKFYEDILGLRPKKESKTWVIYDLGSTELVIAVGAKAQSLSKDYGKTAATSVCFLSENIEKDVAFLKEKGVHLIGEIQTLPQGKLQAFQDPDGNYLELIQ